MRLTTPLPEKKNKKLRAVVRRTVPRAFELGLGIVVYWKG
jgi:hypothetical protein